MTASTEIAIRTVLVDTSILLRSTQLTHPQNETAAHAIEVLAMRGIILCIVPQNLVEFWAVATRPSTNNGLGLTRFAAQAELERLKTAFRLLNETDQIFPTWEALVVEHNVSGKPTHDARLVAAMKVHGLTAILTFDRTGFSRYPGIEVIHPEDVA